MNAETVWCSLFREQLKQEVEILQRLDHPNIVKYRGVFEGDRYIYLVLEYVAGGELFNHIVDENDELVRFLSWLEVAVQGNSKIWF